MISLSQRGKIEAFLAMDVMREAGELARKGASICHMEVGQPGTPAPFLVRERAKQALDEELIGYTEALGQLPLRERIVLHYKETYGVSIDADQVIITTGSSAGFLLSFLATLDAGDHVLITRPGYPCYREILKALDLIPVEVPVGFHNDWMPTSEEISEAIKQYDVKAILLASPANPTGVVFDKSRLGSLVDLAKEKGIWFFSDEIYHGLTYERPADTALSFLQSSDLQSSVCEASEPQVIILNSFSKYYSMTGWRIGWMVVPKSLVRRMEKLNQHLFISAPALSQIAATVAFDALGELEGLKDQYAKNREILTNGLIEAGFVRFAPPGGAFYVYVDVSAFTDDSLEFSKHLLRTHGIAASSGLDFDRVDGNHMLRFSYAGTERDVVEAVNRLKDAKF